MRNPVGSDLSRRELLRNLAGSAGACAVWGQSAAHPIYKHLLNGALMAQAVETSAAEEWTPKVLNAQQNETLIVLAERMVPNSEKAQVNRFIDLLLDVDTAETRQKFIGALAAFDIESMRRFGHRFKKASEAQQNELLSDFSSAPEHGGDAKDGATEDNASLRKRPVQSHAELHDHFSYLKTWISGAYYSSEIGQRELGWTEMRFFVDYPGCQHSGGHS